MMLLPALLVLIAVGLARAEVPPNAYHLNKEVIVHLFEWKWEDIALECERFLRFHGYKAVQISPPNENLVIPGRPWYERYQPVSYRLETRSGTEEQLADMIRRCNDVGVRIIVDAVINHMTADTVDCRGTAGSTCNPSERSYPAVSYSKEHFHLPVCSINDYHDMEQVRICELVGLHDLNQTVEYVRVKTADYMNRLVDLGVAGFRIDAAKHIFPQDLEAIYSKLKDLNTDHGFPSNTKPFIFQEVINAGDGEAFFAQYTDYGLVTEFVFGYELGRCFQGNNDLKWLNNFGEAWNLKPDDQTLVFIENHDTERSDDQNVLTYKNSQSYKMAIAFMLAWDYSSPKVMSSFLFTNTSAGPPHDSEDNILSPQPIQNNLCSNGWVCQHRWRQVYNMVTFHNVVNGSKVQNWWDNGKNQISFCRGNRGFIAFNLESYPLNMRLQTCLPAGTYCDVISGNLVDNQCTGKTVEVSDDGTANIFIDSFGTSDPEKDGVLAIHVQLEVPVTTADTS